MGFSRNLFSEFLILPYSPVVVLDIRREVMGPIIFRDKVEIRDRRRMEGRKNGLFPGVADRGKRKAGSEISIIRSRSQQIFFGQVPIKIFDPIDHGRVTLKRDLFLEPIVEYG